MLPEDNLSGELSAGQGASFYIPHVSHYTLEERGK